MEVKDTNREGWVVDMGHTHTVANGLNVFVEGLNGCFEFRSVLRVRSTIDRRDGEEEEVARSKIIKLAALAPVKFFLILETVPFGILQGRGRRTWCRIPSYRIAIWCKTLSSTVPSRVSRARSTRPNKTTKRRRDACVSSST